MGREYIKEGELWAGGKNKADKRTRRGGCLGVSHTASHRVRVKICHTEVRKKKVQRQR